MPPLGTDDAPAQRRARRCWLRIPAPLRRPPAHAAAGGGATTASQQASAEPAHERIDSGSGGVQLPLRPPERRPAGLSLIPPAVPMGKHGRLLRLSSGFAAHLRSAAPGDDSAPVAPLPAPGVGPRAAPGGTRPLRRTASLLRPDDGTPLRQKTDCLRSLRTPRVPANVAAAAR